MMAVFPTDSTAKWFCAACQLEDWGSFLLQDFFNIGVRRLPGTPAKWYLCSCIGGPDIQSPFWSQCLILLTFDAKTVLQLCKINMLLVPIAYYHFLIINWQMSFYCGIFPDYGQNLTINWRKSFIEQVHEQICARIDSVRYKGCCATNTETKLSRFLVYSQC